ncbi:MAG: N-acetylmannosamine-6-phosphate 2-epimerase [Eubacteriales bacterium]|nr:N-acetylmannosamine-6-phosphate 2-epimerase [Eubacteriales bacterium]
MTKEALFDQIRGGLIVSCQALASEPLYGSEYMAKMAVAAAEGGAAGIRANTPEDIKAIRAAVDLPVIGLYKAEYPDSEVYITPTMKEVDALMEVRPDMIAMDATDRVRPAGMTLEEFFPLVRAKYPDMLFMADCSSFEDAARAQELGFDVAGTTMRGYTAATKGIAIPDYDMLHEMTMKLSIPVIAEGGVWEREQLQRVYQEGILSAVIGTAITRPRDITRRFVEAIRGEEKA